MQSCFLQKLKVQIDRASNTVTARCIYEEAQAVEDNAYSYFMAAQELEAAAQLKKKPGPNNPKAASEFVTNVNTAINKFAYIIHLQPI